MYYIGVDIGGTKAAVSIADGNCTIIDTQITETSKTPDFNPTALAIFQVIDSLLEKTGITAKSLSAIGLSCPGPLDIQKGMISYVATTGWKDVPVVNLFKEKYSVPVFLENDCSSAVYAEAMKGAGRGYSSVLYITVSTGIGSGICINGEVYSGEHGNAGELGHICVDVKGEKCPCGGIGCLQLYSSGSAIAEKGAIEAQKEKSVLSGKKKITAYDVELAVRNHDGVAKRVWEDAMDKLGLGASIAFQLLNPGVIVFGGGVSNAWDLMEPLLLESVRKHIYSVDFKNVVLKQAELGKVVGTTGAILLAHKKYKAL
jgi:glucokinase